MADKIKIRTEDFVEWYFNVSEGREWIHKIRRDLSEKGNFNLNLEDIFYGANRIPSHIRCDYRSSIHRNKDYSPIQCELI
jgi:hypothetical protein